MSRAFNDTTNLNGIIQGIEEELRFSPGDISGDTTKMKLFTAAVNSAWDDYLTIALNASGTWQFDDSNHTDYPFIKTNIVQGQRDYTFTGDEGGNLILDIYKVAILGSATATLYEEIKPIDQQSDPAWNLVAENSTQGVPYQYDKTANAIFLDPVPSYSATSGLKVYINREASYFTTADTSKKPGCPGLHHKYFSLKPALDYARRHSLSVEGSLRNEISVMEKSIEEYFGRRSRDERKRITSKYVSFR